MRTAQIEELVDRGIGFSARVLTLRSHRLATVSRSVSALAALGVLACASSGPGYELEVTVPPLRQEITQVVDDQMGLLGYELDDVLLRSTSMTRTFLKLRPGRAEGSLTHDRIDVTITYHRILTEPEGPASDRGYVIRLRAETFEELREIKQVEPSRTVVEDAAAFIGAMNAAGSLPVGVGRSG